MKINQQEFEFDFNNVDDVERFEKAFAVLNSMQHRGATASEIMKSQIAGIRQFFTTVLGEDAYGRLVATPSNMKANVDALYDFIDCYEAHLKDIELYNKEKTKRYSKYMAYNRR